MPAIQTSYEMYHNPYFVGQLTDTTSCVIESYLVEDANIPFGTPVYQGKTDRGITATPSVNPVTEAVFIGITCSDIMGDPQLFNMANGTPDGYRVGGMAKVLRIGCVAVTADAAVSANDAVALSADGTTFVAAATANAVPLSRARYKASVASGAIVPVEIR